MTIRPLARLQRGLIVDPLAADKAASEPLLPWETHSVGGGTTIFLPGLEFSRLAIASYLVGVGATPLLFAPSNVLRLEDLGDGAGPLALLEKASTNLVLQSAAFGSASWSLVATPTVTSNVATAPDGTVTADSILDNDAGAAERIRQVATLAGAGNIVACVYIQRAAAAPPFPAIFYNGGGDFAGALNPVTGATSAVAPFAPPTEIDAQQIGTNWWRFCIRRTSVAGAAFDIAPAFANPIGTFDPASIGTSIFWGAQVEDNVNYSTSYIPTTTVTVTRDADVLTGDALPLWFFTNPGRLAQFSPIFANTDLVATDQRWLFTIGNANNGVRLRHDGANVVLEAVQNGLVRATSGALVFSENALLGPVVWNNLTGQVTIAGVTGAVGTPWTWARGTVRFGGILNASGSELDGRISQTVTRP